MALINFGAGLSSLGNAVASFGGNAALAYQRQQLEQESMTLADKLATARESAGRVQAGDIAAKAAGEERTFQTGQENIRQTGANTRSTNEIAGQNQRSTAEQAAATARNTADIAGRHEDVNAQVNKTPDDIKFAEWYNKATPEERDSYNQMLLAKAGLPSWAASSAASDVPMPTNASATAPAPSASASAAPAAGDKPAPPAAADSAAPTATAPAAAADNAAPAATAAASAAPTVAAPATKFNEDALKGVPASDARIVKGMVTGTIKPTDFARNPNLMRAYLGKAMEYDPAFNQAKWDARVKLQVDWADGKTSDVKTAANQALNHLDEFDLNAHALNNKGFTPLNTLQNMIGAKFDDPRINDANRTQQAFSEEMGKVYKGTGILGEKETDDWKKTNDINAGPNTLASTAPKTIAMFDGRFDALQQKWRETMGASPMPPLMSPDAQEIYDRLSKGAGRFASSKTGWPTSGPPSNDIAALNSNPQLASKFDAKYGDGAATKYEGRWAAGPADNTSRPAGPALPSNPQNGATSISNSGRDIIFQDGKWLYK